jgi:hypothetical protein
MKVMTPKEKAEELFAKYAFLTISDMSDENFNQTKQCVLIAVDEVLNEENHFIQTDAHFLYWKEVKQEIEKL